MPTAGRKTVPGMTTGGNERQIIHYSGRVQGVGFRYTVRAAANGYNVTGYVQNLDDGRVRLVAEGKPEEIARFQTEVAERMSGYIRNVEEHKSSATGEFSGFSIQH
jgi:acylphosphatase